MPNLDILNRFLRKFIPKRKQNPLLEFAQENLTPIIYPESEQFLRIILSLQKPQKILEIGTAIGYSASFFSNITNAQITTIEVSDEMVDYATHFLAKNENIQILHGDAGKILPTLNESYDFIFLDSAKSHYNTYLPHLIRLLAPGGTLICDNVLLKGKVIAPEYPEHKHRTAILNLRQFLENLTNSSSLQTSILPLGDGMTISIKV